MCVIAIADKKIKESILRQMWDANSDGAGFAYASAGHIFIRKGLLTFDNFLKEYNRHKFTRHIVHFRIASSGSARDPLQTHPFGIGCDLQLKDCIAKPVLFHNGTWPKAIELAALAALMGKKIKGPIMDTRIISMIAANSPDMLYEISDSGYNKFAILYPNGKIKTIGEFVKCDDNILVSNKLWEYSYESHYGYYSDWKQTSFNYYKKGEQNENTSTGIGDYYSKDWGQLLYSNRTSSSNQGSEGQGSVEQQKECSKANNNQQELHVGNNDKKSSGTRNESSNTRLVKAQQGVQKAIQGAKR